ncbi:MAG: IS3 family transposase, partial [Atopobiaceae bacterium]
SLLRRQPGRDELLGLIAAGKGSFGVSTMCRALGIARSSFCDWAARTPEEKDPWAAVREAVLELWESSEGRWGARTMHAMLPDGFAGTTLHRIRKCMHELGMQGIHPRKSRRTAIPGPDAPERPGLVQRHFEPPVPTTVLCGGITCLRTLEGWLHMATVIDLAARMVVGLSFSGRMTADLPIAALASAWGRGFIAGGAIFRSDRGSQYTSRAMAGWALAHGIRLSAGRTGSCHGNAVAKGLCAQAHNDSNALDAIMCRVGAGRQAEGPGHPAPST